MKITRDNYEAYLLDRQEGRLSPEELKELKNFLLDHPDCASELTEDESWTLETLKQPFPGKDRLKKEFPVPGTIVDRDNFDMASIARLEGDLDQDQVSAHEKLLFSDASLQMDWEMWQRTILPARDVIYPGREKLKKARPARTRYLWMVAASAAAVLILFLTLFTPEGPLKDAGTLAVENTDEPLEASIESNQDPNTPRFLGSNSDPGAMDVPGDPLTESPPEAEQGNPVMLRFMKHQDPPERMDPERETKTILPSDSTGRVDPGSLDRRPIRMAYLSGKGPGLYPGSQDQIQALWLPPVEVSSPPRGLREATRAYMEDRDISLLSIASAGIEGLNRLTGADMGLALSKEESGEVSGFRFRSDLLKVDAPVGKSE